jgi:hypothetical protein
MRDAWNSIRIREFEHILAAPTVALLRVSGKPPRRRSTAGPRPVLVANDGTTIRRFAAIPAPADDRGVLRAAYSVSSDLLAPGNTFSLELTDGSVVALPAPQPGVSRLLPDPGVGSPSEPPDTPEPPDGTDERRSGLVSKLTELSARLAESEQARDELHQSVAPMSEASERVEHEVVEARERAARAETEAKQSAAALAELETWRGELERRLTETIDELSETKIARAGDEGELLRLSGELAGAEAKVELLQAQLTELTDQLAQADDRRAATSAAAGHAPVPYSPSERESIAHQAGQLAGLLGGAERLTELASELAGARAQAEILHATASAEPAPEAAAQAATADALSAARVEIEGLRAELAQVRHAEAQVRAEAVSSAAEAEARDLAEQELARAVSPGE